MRKSDKNVMLMQIVIDLYIEYIIDNMCLLYPDDFFRFFPLTIGEDVGSDSGEPTEPRMEAFEG